MMGKETSWYSDEYIMGKETDLLVSDQCGVSGAKGPLGTVINISWKRRPLGVRSVRCIRGKGTSCVRSVKGECHGKCELLCQISEMCASGEMGSLVSNQ